MGSSRMTSGASRRNARASAIRWSWPADSGRPPSPTTRVVPVGELVDELLGAGQGRRGPHLDPRSADVVAEPDVLGDRAAEEGRPLRHPGDLGAPGGRVAIGQVDRPGSDASARGVDETKEERDDRALAAPARPDERDRLAGHELEVDRVEHGSRPSRVGEGDSLEAHRHLERARRRGSPGAARGGRRLLEQLEETLRDGQAVGARVVLGREIAQREVELGREHEHREACLEAETASDQADADCHRDERDPERRSKLEHGAREERDAQRPHRRAAVLVARMLDPLPLHLGRG